ncbi:MAG: hypothetical protein GC155_01895 [Alphaproteobacteria bacterium]|nr:hypothetical protein [Alphaproteobacteria bacterium]
MDPELDAMAKVLAALEPLSGDARDRVMSWVADKLGLNREHKVAAGPNQPVGIADIHLDAPVEHGTLPSRVVLWMKQNDVSTDELSEIFHIAGGEAQLIVGDMPGRNNKERTLNGYVLAGLSQFLVSGDPTFTDRFARDLCSSAGCLDLTNHARYLNGRGNEFTGSKERGWALTAPGLKRAAAIIKEATAK